MAGPSRMVGLFTILAVVQTGSLFSADAWNNVTFTAGEVRNPRRNLPLSLAMGTGLVLTLYILSNFVYLMALPLHGDPHGATIFARGIQYASEDRVATAVLQQIFLRARSLPDGGGDPDFDLWMRQRADTGRRARLLRDEPRRAVLQGRGQLHPTLQDASGVAGGAGGLDLLAVSFGVLRPVAGLHDVRGVGVSTS